MPAHLTDAEKEEIVALYRSGDPTDAIAAQYGCSRSYPRMLAKRAGIAARVMKRAERELKPRSTATRIIAKPMAPKAAEPFQAIDMRIRADVNDTRSLTSKLFGDPLPGRSALDQKRAAECQ